MIAIVAIFGAVIGSFLSVCIFRLPLSPAVGLTAEELGLEEGDVVQPMTINSPARSLCPHCKAQLRWHHNIPIISWLFLRGKCAYCKHKISFRYPLVEILTLIAAVLCAYFFGYTSTAALTFVIICALIVISFIDYDYYIIPNVISLPGAVLGLVTAIANQYFKIFAWPIAPNIYDSLWGVGVGAGFLLLVSELYLRLRKQEGLGMGDVKLLAFVGAFFGFQGAVFTIFVGSFVGTIGGVITLIIARKGMSHPLPFGPSLAMGTILYIFCSEHFSLFSPGF